MSALISEVSTRLKQIEDQFGTRLEKIEESADVGREKLLSGPESGKKKEKMIEPVIRKVNQHSETSRTTVIEEQDVPKVPSSVSSSPNRGKILNYFCTKFISSIGASIKPFCIAFG